MTDQNAELLRLLEQEEAQTSRLSTTNEVSRRMHTQQKRDSSYVREPRLF